MPDRSRRLPGGSVTLLVAVLVCLAWPKPAYAYIDPALGSMILQAALAAIIGVGVFFRDVRLKIMSLFRRRDSRKAEPD